MIFFLPLCLQNPKYASHTNDVIKCCKMMSSNVALLHSNNCCIVDLLEPAICEDLDLHVANIFKVKVTHQGECHIKAKVKYLHPFKFYVAHTLCKQVVCIRLKCYLFCLFTGGSLHRASAWPPPSTQGSSLHMFKLDHYKVWTVGKRAVGTRLKCLLVLLHVYYHSML